MPEVANISGATMLSLFLASLMFIGLMLCVMFVSAWVLREHHDARCYRANKPRPPAWDASTAPVVLVSSTPMWRIEHKERGKLRTIEVEGETEEEVLSKVIKMGTVDMRSIMSITKV